MSPSPLTFVPVFLGLALHIAGFVAPHPPQAQCFAGATVAPRAAWRAAQVGPVDLDRGYARHRIDTRPAQAVPCRADSRPPSCLQQAQKTLPPGDPPTPVSRLAVFEARMNTLPPAAMARATPRGSGARSAETGGAPVRP